MHGLSHIYIENFRACRRLLLTLGDYTPLVGQNNTGKSTILEPVQNLPALPETGRMRKSYPSDISRKQFEQVKPLLEEARKKTRPRTVELYEVFCAVLYVLKSGCPWRMLPEGFPPWRTVHAYFQIWSEVDEEGESLLERALKKSGWRGPRKTGAQRLKYVLDRGRAEREECGYG